MSSGQFRSVFASSAKRVTVGLWVLSLAGCLTGCLSLGGPAPQVGPNVSQTRVVSAPPAVDPQEVAIAEAEHPKILAAYGGTYENSAIEAMVARVVGRLVAASTEPWRSYRVTILNSPVVNAFALPGGYVYVTRGLLALASDSSELAAVISHEMAHVTQRHAFARAKRLEAAQMAGQVVAQVINDPDVTRTVQASTERSLASFSQTQELEADQIGIQTLTQAGYDPFGAARFLHAMARFSAYRTRGQDPNPGADFLSSHPSTPEREALAYEEAKRLSPKPGERGEDAFLTAIDGLLYGDDPSQGYVRNRQFLHARLGLAFQVPETFNLENTSKSVLATDRSGLAMRFDGTAIPEGTDLVTYLQSGWMSGIDPISIRTTNINGLPAAIAEASNRGFSYRVAAVRFGAGVYRFLFAARRESADMDQAFAATLASFRPLTPAEVAQLRPTHIRVVQLQPGQALAQLALQMPPYFDAPEQLLRAINDLGPNDTPPAGAKLKIITDQ